MYFEAQQLHVYLNKSVLPARAARMFVLRKPLLAHPFRGEEVSTYRHLLCAPLKNGSHGWKNSPPVSTRLPTQSSTGASSPTTPSGDLRAFRWRLHDLQPGCARLQIRSRLRPLYPHVTSLMMDRETFITFADFCVPSTPCPIRRLSHLTPKEHAPFVCLAEHNLRLEQERISHSDAVKQLISILFL